MFNAGSARAVKAFAADGAMERIMQLPFGDLPGSGLRATSRAVDTFTHGWDLAKATGQSTDLDPELAAQLLAIAQAYRARRVPRPEAAGAVRADRCEAAGGGRSPADQLARRSLGRQAPRR